MTSDVARGESRNREILRNAIQAFGAYGVRGASLRDIARRAGVSLTLIHHHFGNKPSLVWASADSMRRAGAAPLSQLKRELGAPMHSAADLVAAWVRYLVAAFGSDARMSYLRLIDRLRNDPDVEHATQVSLDVAAPVVREALSRLFPAAPARSVDLVLASARAALFTVMLDACPGERDRSEQAPLDVEAIELVQKFVGAAVQAALGRPQRSPGLQADDRDLVTN